MKKIYLLLLFTSITYAQTNWSAEVNLPLSADSNFFSQYKNYVDVGAQYLFNKDKAFRFGIKMNVGFHSFSHENAFAAVNFKTNCITLQPKAVLSYENKALAGFRPSLGVGVSFFRFDGSGVIYGEQVSSTETSKGLNINPALAYDINERWFVQAQYDFTRLSDTNADIPENTYNNNINLIKLGIGVRF